MQLHELIALLNRIYVWLPDDSPIRPEVKQVIQNLKAQQQ
jgi:hypothetical protein